MATETKELTKIKSQLSDILLEVSWAKISKRYFNRSATWIYHKMDGIYNAGNGTFSEAEKEELKNALKDLSQRIYNAAENIK